MFTTIYKGFYIHGYCNDPECQVQHGDPSNGYIGTYKSMLAAKQAITKYILKHQTLDN